MTLRRLGLAPVADNVPGLMMRDRSAIRDALENGAAGQAGTVCGGYELRGCINVNCWAEEADPRAYKSYEAGLELQRRVPNVFGTYGLHPHNADRWSRALESRIRAALTEEKSVAVGECGLDFYRNLSPADTQRRVFRAQIRLAQELGKPLVVHARAAEPEALRILREEFGGRDWRIHLHCYTGDRDTAVRYLEAFDSLCIGFTGCIGFRGNDALREVVRAVPLGRLLVETDAPFMAPRPFRGKVCHVGMTPLVARAVSGLHGVPLGTVMRVTTANALRVYGIGGRA